jgi:hypothetical protein
MAIPDLTTQSGALFAAAFAVQHLGALGRTASQVGEQDVQRLLPLALAQHTLSFM